MSPSNSGDARNAAGFARRAGKAPSPTGLPPPSIGSTRALAGQNGGGCSGAAARRALPPPLRWPAARRGTATPARSVTNCCRPNTSAGRPCGRPSSPRRDPCPRPRRCGCRASAPSSSSPSVGTFRCSRRDRVGDRRACRARARPRRNRPSCRARLRLVEPVVGDDPGPRRAVAGEDGRMAGAGLGRGVALIAVVEHGAVSEARQPAVKCGRYSSNRSAENWSTEMTTSSLGGGGAAAPVGAGDRTAAAAAQAGTYA